MGFFNFLGNRDRAENQFVQDVPWEVLSSLEQLEEIDRISESVPVVIFKHSTRCGISSMVLRRFEKSFDYHESAMKLYFLDLLRYRNVSDEIAIRYQVLHQSPQLIVIKGGNQVFNASHHNIGQADLEAFL